MDKRNKTALAYLLVGVAAAGRALLAVPENAAIQEVSLTVLALVGYLLLASKTRLPTVFGAAGLVLELILCGSQTCAMTFPSSGRLHGWPRRCARQTCGCSGARPSCWCGWQGGSKAKCRTLPPCRWPSTPSRTLSRR